MALTKVTPPMLAGDIPFSKLKGASINVLDYAHLAVSTNCRDPGDPASHLLPVFLNWSPAINAALDACFAAGGGSVVLPKNTVPYYIQDEIVVRSNVTFICEDWIILADYNFSGHAIRLVGENVVLQNVKLDNSNIRAGGSGYNGVVVVPNPTGANKNIKVFGGHIKNCSRGSVSPADGGKGVQIEPGEADAIVVDGVTLTNCFMGMSTIRDFGTAEPYNGIVYSNITAFDCSILFFVRQTNGAQSETGLQHSIILNGFYARNCGAYEGVLQFSRASNVLVANGTVVCDPSTSPTSLIRGNHANCTFDNIGWYGNTYSCVNLDPGDYSPDSSQPNRNNVYNINVWGQISTFANASLATAYRTLDGCVGNITFRLEPNVAFVGYELRNGSSVFNMSCNTGPFGASKTVVVNTNKNFYLSGYPSTFAGFSAGYNIGSVSGTNETTFISIAAAAVPNNTLFLNPATGRLSFKDGAGVVNALY